MKQVENYNDGKDKNINLVFIFYQRQPTLKARLATILVKKNLLSYPPKKSYGFRQSLCPKRKVKTSRR